MLGPRRPEWCDCSRQHAIVFSSGQTKLLRSRERTLAHARAGTSQLAGETAVVDVLMYAGFGILMIACFWFIDRTLKDDGD